MAMVLIDIGIFMISYSNSFLVAVNSLIINKRSSSPILRVPGGALAASREIALYLAFSSFSLFIFCK